MDNTLPIYILHPRPAMHPCSTSSMLVVIKTQQPRPVAVEKYQLRSETLMEPRSVLSAAISINGDGELLRARTYLPAELLYTQLADDTDGLSCLLGSQQEDCPSYSMAFFPCLPLGCRSSAVRSTIGIPALVSQFTPMVVAIANPDLDLPSRMHRLFRVGCLG
jgi:hypothetical protein